MLLIQYYTCQKHLKYDYALHKIEQIEIRDWVNTNRTYCLFDDLEFLHLNKRWLYYPFFQAFFLHGNSKSSWLISETLYFVSKSNPLFPFLNFFSVKNSFEVNLQPTNKKLNFFFKETKSET